MEVEGEGGRGVSDADRLQSERWQSLLGRSDINRSVLVQACLAFFGIAAETARIVSSHLPRNGVSGC